MKQIFDLSQHEFKSKNRGKTPNYINFNSSLFGEGILGCYSPSKDISILYINAKPVDDFIWQSNKEWKNNDTIYFNYFLQTPPSLQILTTSGELEKLPAQKTLITDGTADTSKSLLLSKDDPFELFQLALSHTQFENYLNLFLKDFPEEIKHVCSRKQTDTYQAVKYFAIDPAEELCIRDITIANYKRDLLAKYVNLKVSTLIINFFQRMINGGPLNVSDEMNKADEEAVLVEQVKKIIENNPTAKLSVDDVGKIIKMNPKKLNTMFQKYVGSSIASFQRKSKLQYAYNYLNANQANGRVSEIAFETGFASVASFSRAFYNLFHIRPSDLLPDNLTANAKQN